MTSANLGDHVCPHPSKKAYETRQAAVFFAVADGLRPYRCPCGKWHLSSSGVRTYAPPTGGRR